MQWSSHSPCRECTCVSLSGLLWPCFPESIFFCLRLFSSYDWSEDGHYPHLSLSLSSSSSCVCAESLLGIGAWLQGPHTYLLMPESLQTTQPALSWELRLAEFLPWLHWKAHRQFSIEIMTIWQSGLRKDKARAEGSIQHWACGGHICSLQHDRTSWINFLGVRSPWKWLEHPYLSERWGGEYK